MDASLSQIPVVDVDTHYNEPHDLWTSRAPARLRERVPRVLQREDGTEYWAVENGAMLFPSPGSCVIRADGSKLQGVSLERAEEMHPGSTDPIERMAVMDEHGIRAQIIYPNLIGFMPKFFVDQVADTGLRDFCVRTYNDHMGQVQEAGGGRLFPQAIMPFWDIDRCVEELRHAHDELGLTGIVISGAPESFGLAPLSDTAWDPLWHAAQERGVPVNFHIGGGGVNLEPWNAEDEATAFAVMSTLAISGNIRCVVNLIFSGLLDRFPELKFVSVESGLGWIPYVLELCEYQFDQNGVSTLQLRPTEYFRRQIYASYWFEHGTREAIEKLGEDNIMFETDFPHPTCLYPEIREQIHRTLDGVAPRVQRKILCETAARLYGLPISVP